MSVSVHPFVRRSPKASITRHDLAADLAIAAATVAVTAGLHMLLVRWVHGAPPVTLFVATSAALTFWRGLGPGMLATSLGTPVGSALLGSWNAPVHPVPIEYSLMLASSLFICWLIYRLRAEQETVERVHAQKDHALACVWHELRQPLCTVHLAASMLERDRSDGARDRAMELITRSADRLTHVVEDLADITRLRAPGLRIEKTRMGLQDPILAAVDACAPGIAQRHQVLQVNVPSAPPLWINGDATRLEQVFANLLTNASRYSPEGAEISVSVRTGNGRAVAVVRDSGIGISREMLERVFEPFVREVASAEGLGIGLTLARGLIAKHGGTITAHSDGPGRGSTFIVDLPLAAES